MIKQGHIDRAEAILLLWFGMGAKVLLALPATLAAEGYTAGWMIVVGGGLVAMVAFLPGVWLMRRFHDVSFPRVAETVGGVILGKISGLVVSSFFIGLAALTLREISESISAGILPRTPVDVLALTMALACAYCAYQGLEATGRLTVFLAPWILLFFAGVILAEFGLFDLRHLTPIWGPGPGVILTRSLLRSSLFAEILVLPILMPYLRRPAQATGIGVWAIALSIFILAFTVAVVALVFDVVNADRLSSPVIELARLVMWGKFITRVEAFLIIVWILTAAIKLTLILWAGTLTLAETLRLPSHRPLFAPVTAIFFGGATFLRENRQASALEFDYLRNWAWVVAFALPLILWLLAVARGKGGSPRNEPSESQDEQTQE